MSGELPPSLVEGVRRAVVLGSVRTAADFVRQVEELVPAAAHILAETLDPAIGFCGEALANQSLKVSVAKHVFDVRRSLLTAPEEVLDAIARQSRMSAETMEKAGRFLDLVNGNAELRRAAISALRSN
jgi:hypothetical protein